MQNNKRHLKNFKKRSSKQVSYKMEQLAAAFLLETKLPADQVRLRQSTDVEQGRIVTNVWFEALPEKANIDDQHEDIKYMFDLLFSIDAFCKNKSVDSLTTEHKIEIQGWLEMVNDFMTKYSDEPATPVMKGSIDAVEISNEAAD